MYNVIYAVIRCQITKVENAKSQSLYPIKICPIVEHKHNFGIFVNAASVCKRKIYACLVMGVVT